MKLAGRVALVTGAAINLGYETARTLALDGASLICYDIDADAAESAAAHIREAGGKAVAAHGDVSDPAAVEAALDLAESAFGTVDILINNAGILIRKHMLETTLAEWQRVVDVCLTGQFVVAQAVARRLVACKKPGVIVNMCSTSGRRGSPPAFAYSAAKGAVPNLTRSMARELGPHGIRVCSVTPTRTGQPTRSGNPLEPPRVQNPDPGTIPLGRIGDPRDIALTIRFLVSDDAAFITGSDVRVDGGALA